jgi:hypothetical protein
MGKTARNEQIKLKATFYNNLAITVLASGAFIPYLAFWPKHPFDNMDVRDIGSTLVAIGVAFGAGCILRYKANEAIAQLED